MSNTNNLTHNHSNPYESQFDPERSHNVMFGQQSFVMGSSEVLPSEGSNFGYPATYYLHPSFHTDPPEVLDHQYGDTVASQAYQAERDVHSGLTEAGYPSSDWNDNIATSSGQKETAISKRLKRTYSESVSPTSAKSGDSQVATGENKTLQEAQKRPRNNTASQRRSREKVKARAAQNVRDLDTMTNKCSNLESQYRGLQAFTSVLQTKMLSRDVEYNEKCAEAARFRQFLADHPQVSQQYEEWDSKTDWPIPSNLPPTE